MKRESEEWYKEIQKKLAEELTPKKELMVITGTSKNQNGTFSFVHNSEQE